MSSFNKIEFNEPSIGNLIAYEISAKKMFEVFAHKDDGHIANLVLLEASLHREDGTPLIEQGTAVEWSDSIGFATYERLVKAVNKVNGLDKDSEEEEKN